MCMVHMHRGDPSYPQKFRVFFSGVILVKIDHVLVNVNYLYAFECQCHHYVFWHYYLHYKSQLFHETDFFIPIPSCVRTAFAPIFDIRKKKFHKFLRKVVIHKNLFHKLSPFWTPYPQKLISQIFFSHVISSPKVTNFSKKTPKRGGK